ncbi:hypothetical protein HX780_06745 [Pseudomonas tolaasii]|uniref:hypothetical protein n=1 Tax=Pseudomonas tolaasii TaxID=29442 RepID=UPI0015A2EFAE|nr:hypothetical protein [Pseudomonas tolaasii]NVZ45128.1 hypothetical protein [Pseudomonas tolaasii]NWA47990.1 hypothetical protein [Pseudomonas tolaasii]
MSIKKTLIHFNNITLTLSADDLKAALIAKYGDAASEVLVDGVILQSSTYSTYFPDDGVKFTFAQPPEGHSA